MLVVCCLYLTSWCVCLCFALLGILLVVCCLVGVFAYFGVCFYLLLCGLVMFIDYGVLIVNGLLFTCCVLVLFRFPCCLLSFGDLVCIVDLPEVVFWELWFVLGLCFWLLVGYCFGFCLYFDVYFRLCLGVVVIFWVGGYLLNLLAGWLFVIVRSMTLFWFDLW